MVQTIKVRNVRAKKPKKITSTKRAPQKKKKPTSYARGKESARTEAIDWQTSDKAMSYADLVKAHEHFSRQAKKFGLKKEFEENGIL